MKAQRNWKPKVNYKQKQELERNQIIQHLNQPDTEIGLDKCTLENTKLLPSISKRVPPHQVAQSKVSFLAPIIFHVITEGQKRAFNMDSLSFTENLEVDSTNFLPFEKH